MFQNLHIDNFEKFPEALQELLNKHREIVESVCKSDSSSYATILKPLQDLDEELSLFFSPLAHFNSVMNSEETRKAYEASIPLLSKFSSEIAQNKILFDKIKILKSDDAEAQTVIDHEVRSFILAGAKLPEDKKKRMEEISLRLSELGNNFSQNLLDATNDYELIIENEEDVNGLPESDLEAAKTELDGKTVYKFTLQFPSYFAYMTYGPNRKLRETLSKARVTRAPENAQVIDEILALRHEKAVLLGFASYADFALQTRDAPTEENVISFLEELGEAATPQAKRELEELQAFVNNVSDITTLEGHDIGYYSEKLKKEKFDFDDAQTKSYFQTTKVVSGVLDIVSELFDVSFVLLDIPTWHECVQVYDIFENDKLSGRIYFDLEARKEKRGGAWMKNWETHFVDASNKTHLASAFVVCNFPAKTEKSPSLLRHSDVVTLFHEMGHAIHHLFSKCKERSVSGINGVSWDVVEFPSQFLENFAYESAILKRFGFHYQSGDAIPEHLILKIKESKNYHAALGILRQVQFSLFDFKLHQNLHQGKEVQSLLDEIRSRFSLMTVPSYNKFQQGFSHIFAGGYAAGYYSYKWAEVFSADAFFECLDEETGLNKEKAQGYKRYILEKGGSIPMSDLYQQWLGREGQNVKSLIKLYEIS